MKNDGKESELMDNWYDRSLSFSFSGIMSATGNGYVIYMTMKRKTKLKPPELMTVNLAIFDFGISGTASLRSTMQLCLSTGDIDCVVAISITYYFSTMRTTVHYFIINCFASSQLMCLYSLICTYCHIQCI